LVHARSSAITLKQIRGFVAAHIRGFGDEPMTAGLLLNLAALRHVGFGRALSGSLRFKPKNRGPDQRATNSLSSISYVCSLRGLGEVVAFQDFVTLGDFAPLLRYVQINQPYSLVCNPRGDAVAYDTLRHVSSS
jgi:hypothetical protein